YRTTRYEPFADIAILADASPDFGRRLIHIDFKVNRHVNRIRACQSGLLTATTTSASSATCTCCSLTSRCRGRPLSHDNRCTQNRCSTHKQCFDNQITHGCPPNVFALLTHILAQESQRINDWVVG